MILQGRFAVVTGGNQGLGLAISRALLAEGVRGLTICARDEARLAEAEAELKPALTAGQQLLAIRCDVADCGSVDEFSRQALAAFGRIDILVNNAGIHGPLGPIEEVDWALWASAIAVNLTGLAYMCRAMISSMKQAGYGKIINLSGGGATNPMPRFSAYAASKAGVVRLTETLAEELREHRIDVNAVAPGMLHTRLTDEVIGAGPDAVGSAYFERVKKAVADGKTSTPETAARLCAYLASAASDGLSGKLLSAQWDPWPDFEGHRKEIEANDIYTLRRIVPKDRGEGWGDK